jgi:hypothetical protein
MTRPLLSAVCSISSRFSLLAIGWLGLGFFSFADQPVGEVPASLREELELSPFYQKHLDLEGLPILGSSKVSAYALKEAEWIIRQITAAHPGILKTLGQSGARVVVMAHHEYTTDIPEQAGLEPKEFWDKRARGLGGKISSCGEENLLGFPGDPYSTENILIHEFSHTIHSHGLADLIPDFDARLQNAYDNARKAGLWKGTYAATNAAEYWAEAAQSWFDNNRKNDELHNDIDTREKLKAYDPEVAKLCREVFGDGEWRYQKPEDRPASQREHLIGYDATKAPTFTWRVADESAKDSKEIRSVDLRELLRRDVEIAPFEATQLSPEWVGTLQEEGRSAKDMRINRIGAVQGEGGGAIVWIARMEANGGYIVSERAEFRPTLPATSEIKKAGNLAELQGLLGHHRPGLGGEQDGELLRSTAAWTCFTSSEDGNLRWIGVFAHISGREADWSKSELVKINKLSVTEGALRPADATSEEDRKRYLSIDEIRNREEMERAAAREKIPEPLRSLVAAKEAPEDSSLDIYGAALARIRQNPDPRLFQQLAALDRSRIGHSFLKDIFRGVPSHPPIWPDEGRKAALRHAVDALSQIRAADKLQQDVLALLWECNTHHLQIREPEIDLTVTKNGGYTETRWGVKPENLPEAIAAIVDWFHQRL